MLVQSGLNRFLKRVMKHKLKIAIYSGDIPSTTFIERLIHGLSNAAYHIYLFGL